jgi:hypothetical protein
MGLATLTDKFSNYLAGLLTGIVRGASGWGVLGAPYIVALRFHTLCRFTQLMDTVGTAILRQRAAWRFPTLYRLLRGVALSGYYLVRYELVSVKYTQRLALVQLLAEPTLASLVPLYANSD